MAPELRSDDEITEALASLPDWERAGDRLTATFTFPDFPAALAFMNAVAPEAERLNHHPEWSNVYNRVSIELTTHDAGGLTGLDLELAGIMSTKAADHR